jgi:hypothetical protein
MIYEVETPDGKIFELEGDSPPTEQELEEIYSKISEPKQNPISEPLTQGMQAPVSNVPNVELPTPIPLPTPPSWGEASIQGLKNIPSSGRQALKDIGGAIAHPIETLKNIGKLGLGTLVKAGSVVNPNMDWIPELEETKKYPEAMADFYANRYGGSENIKQTLINDPVGMLSDLASVLSLGGGAVSKVGQAGKIGKVGRAISKVGNAIEPINIVGKGLGLAGKGAGKILKHGLGITTGAGADAISEAVKAGKTGSKTFLENIRNKVPQREVLPLVSDALDTIRMKAKNDYTSDMGKVLNDPTVLDVSPIQNKMLDLIDDTAYKNFEKIGRKSKLKMDEMTKVISEMERKPAIHTAEGLDAIKRRLNEIEIPYDSRMAERARTTLTNTIKDTIQKQHPVYADVMKNWWEMEELNNQMKKTLSLNPNATIDTQLRKLQSVMRNNVNTGYGHRLELVKELNKYNPDILPALAGQSLSSVSPRGLQGITATGAGITGIASNPNVLLTLPAFSPRVVGETSYLTGRLQELLNKMPVGNINRGLYQGGRINRITEEKR